MIKTVAQVCLIAFCSGSMFACGQSAPPDSDPNPADDTPDDMADDSMDDDEPPSDAGDAPSKPDAGGVVDMTDYFPMVDGAMYRYAHSTGWIETVEVSETTYDGKEAFLVVDSGDSDGHSEQIMVIDGSAVLRVEAWEFDPTGAELQRVEYVPGFMRADSAWANEKPGAEFTLAYERIEFQPGGAEKRSDRQHIYTIESTGETVKTAAGTFRDCIRIRRKRDWMADIPDSEAQEKIYWFAPGVGKVREETLTTGKTELLIEFDIP